MFFVFQLISSNVENLLNRKNDVGWAATKPAGVEGDSLVRTMGTFASVLARRIEYHVKDGHIKKQNPQKEALKPYTVGKLNVVEENLGIIFIFKMNVV